MKISPRGYSHKGADHCAHCTKTVPGASRQAHVDVGPGPLIHKYPCQRSVTECHDAARIPKPPSKPKRKSQETLISQMTLRAHIEINISILFLGSYCEDFKLDLSSVFPESG
jgi:hypothetical protein